MAINTVPSVWIPSWSEDGTNITVPIASFPLLTAAEADGATGDIRKIALAFLEQLYDSYSGTAIADRPGKMVITRTPAFSAATDQTTITYSVSFVTESTAYDVVSES